MKQESDASETGRETRLMLRVGEAAERLTVSRTSIYALTPMAEGGRSTQEWSRPLAGREEAMNHASVHRSASDALSPVESPRQSVRSERNVVAHIYNIQANVAKMATDA